MQFLSANLKYPITERIRGLEGRVVVNFIVEKDGSVSNARVVESISKRLDREAIRVVKKMPTFQPGMEDGLNVRFTYNLPIWFKLD